jgi:acetyl-CoA C-acetyltransferase
MFSKSLKIDISKNATITGGMPFAGGPLNSYVIHSTIKMISKIRDDNSKVGIVTGVSGMMTKQSYALWSKNPEIEFAFKDFTVEAKNKEIPIGISKIDSGQGTIIGCTTIIIDNKYKAVIYLNCQDGKRKLITSSDESIIKSMESEEWVKRKVYFKNNQLVY